MRDIIIIFRRFSILWGPGRFSIGCGLQFRAEVAYLEVGSSDLEQIHETNIFDKIQVFVLVRGGLRREILVNNGILNSENAFSSFFVSPRRPSARIPGEKWHYNFYNYVFSNK